VSEIFNPTKRFEISTPYDPVHLTHVGFNSSTGEFTGLPKEWQQLLQESGISRSEQEKNPQAVMEIVKFYQEGHGDVWDKLGNVGANQELSFLQPRVDESFQNPVGNQDLSSPHIFILFLAFSSSPSKETTIPATLFSFYIHCSNCLPASTDTTFNGYTCFGSLNISTGPLEGKQTNRSRACKHYA
jgi:hypothetical protein